MKRKLNKRSVALLVSLAVILTAAVGVTLAYIFTRTDILQNTFTPAQVSCAVVENGNDYTNNRLEVESKGAVSIRNTGNTNAYIRAAVVVTWKSADGTTVYAKAPTASDYVIAFSSNQGWTKVGDYYYYGSPVLPGATTNDLIDSVTVNNKSITDEQGNTYYLSIEIVSSAIQSTLGTSAQDAWNVAATTPSQGG